MTLFRVLKAQQDLVASLDHVVYLDETARLVNKVRRDHKDNQDPQDRPVSRARKERVVSRVPPVCADKTADLATGESRDLRVRWDQQDPLDQPDSRARGASEAKEVQTVPQAVLANLDCRVS